VEVSGDMYVAGGIVGPREKAILSDAARQLLTGTIVGGPDIAQELVQAFNSTRFVDEEAAVRSMITTADGRARLLQMLQQTGTKDEFLALVAVNANDVDTLLAAVPDNAATSLLEHYVAGVLDKDNGVAAITGSLGGFPLPAGGVQTLLDMLLTQAQGPPAFFTTFLGRIATLTPAQLDQLASGLAGFANGMAALAKLLDAAQPRAALLAKLATLPAATIAGEINAANATWGAALKNAL
jgi:hypothetical protein